MGSLYRSEPMTHCQVFLQSDSAYAVVAELGELGAVQFSDLNPDVTQYQRKFVNDVRRCEEMERSLRYVESECVKDGVVMPDIGHDPEVPQLHESMELEAKLSTIENDLREISINEAALRKNYFELSELKQVLRSAELFFAEGNAPTREDVEAMSETMGNEALSLGPNSVKLNFVTGILLLQRLRAFEVLLWRACRGNVFFKYSEVPTEMLELDTTGEPIFKVAFVIFFQGEHLKARVTKICESFKASLYNCPSSSEERIGMAVGLTGRLEELTTVIKQTRDHRRQLLESAAKDLRFWVTQVVKIKAVYHILNMFNFDVTQKVFLAECWCPTADLDIVDHAIKRGTVKSGAAVQSFLQRIETNETPPTFFRVNKFTRGFQNIVDAYGVASYQEINPAPYTIITFPFLFGIMFGDVGHGILMAVFAAALVIKERSIQAARVRDEIFSTFFNGRYIILLMGLFSIYTGFIYNDVFAKAFNIFGSGWRVNAALNKELPNKDLLKVQLDPNTTMFDYNNPYPFGLDPVWQIAENKLLFANSFKMKMSVIIGIFQMIFGVVLSLLNHLKFKQYVNIWCEFIPEMLFMLCIFFYLCITIFYKWTHFGAYAHGTGAFQYAGPHCAPSLLIGLISMVMFTDRKEGLHPGEGTGSTDCYLHTYYPGQAPLEHFLLIVAVICIPWMLVIKPFILRSQHRKMVAATAAVRHAEVEDGNGTSAVELTAKTATGGHGHGHGHGQDFAMADVFIHQAIHTIEYCLGCVSHTASYLRLWALSLAHAELSEVLWTMVLKNAFTMSSSAYTGCIACYIIFFAFACLTIAILVVMEGLSAFLHALRLHWVEFNSKFYKGDGYAFMPFTFRLIVEEARTAEETET